MILLILVAIVWGTSNALMKKYVTVEQGDQAKPKNILYSLLNEFISIVRNWKYLLCFGTNQLGSLLYYYSLSQYEFVLAGPITNALTLVFTYIGDKVFFDSHQNKFEKMGLALVCVGVLICFYDKM